MRRCCLEHGIPFALITSNDDSFCFQLEYRSWGDIGLAPFESKESIMSHLKKVSVEGFAGEVFSSPIPVVVDFYADWCTPCRVLAPFLEKCAELYRGDIKFLKANIDELPEIAASYRIDAVPALLFFLNGQLIDRFTGIPSAKLMATRLDDLAHRIGKRR
jgi:thioredoxin 1